MLYIQAHGYHIVRLKICEGKRYFPLESYILNAGNQCRLTEMKEAELIINTVPLIWSNGNVTSMMITCNHPT